MQIVNQKLTSHLLKKHRRLLILMTKRNAKDVREDQGTAKPVGV